MSITRRRRLAGPLFGVLVLVVAGSLAFTPVVPSVGAVDPTPAPSETPPPTPDPTPGATPDPTPASTPDPTPVPVPDPSSTPPPDPSPAPDPSSTPGPSPTPTPTPAPTPTGGAVRGSVAVTVDAPLHGRRRVDPGSVVTATISARLLDDAIGVRLVAAIPPGWSVPGAGDGVVAWSEGDLKAGSLVTETVRLRAPGRSPAGRPAFDAELEARLEHAGGILDTARVSVRVAPAIIVEHVTVARIDSVSHEAAYLAPNEPLDGVGRYDVFRIRFQVRNADVVPVTLIPRLQYRPAGGTDFADVPNGKRALTVPFYVGREWRPASDGRGTVPGPDAEPIPAEDLRVRDRDDESQEPAAGERLMGSRQARQTTLAGETYTEVEFTVRATRALPLGEAFELRLVDDGRAILGAVVAGVRTASLPALSLSPGQREGVPVGPPVDAVASPVSGMDAPQVLPSFTGVAWPESGAAPRYRLAVAAPTTPRIQYALNAPFTSPHVPDSSLVTDACATCHRTHVAQSAGIVSETAPQAALCFACHDGTGSNLDTKAQFADPTVPANDAATRSYFRHDAEMDPVAPNGHALAGDDEFGGVANRHSICADCHNSHNATADLSTQTTTGWTVAGQNASVSGVSVTNGGAGASPVYAFRDGTVASRPTREYELCLKCHSGYTILNPNDGQPPSRYALDKAVELNPSNASYHPVEAAGTNATAAMAGSLAGTSPFKQWNFTTGGTVRCVNCHGDPRAFDAATPPAAGADLAPHTSQFRGLLIQGYRDRVLKGQLEPYDAADFALCYVCHAEAPFLNSTYAGTNFLDHDKHVTRLINEGTNSSTDIDTPGAGQGNAICSECHFRTHGTALAYKVGDRSNARLVNFAPNVTEWNGVVSFVAKSAIADGSCTLVCHGQAHENEGY
jgi:predicted CXXCH cytochrome family protein